MYTPSTLLFQVWILPTSKSGAVERWTFENFNPIFAIFLLKRPNQVYTVWYCSKKTFFVNRSKLGYIFQAERSLKYQIYCPMESHVANQLQCFKFLIFLAPDCSPIQPRLLRWGWLGPGYFLFLLTPHHTVVALTELAMLRIPLQPTFGIHHLVFLL